MRVTILSVGTRGDFQPLLALGLGLATAGHEVRLAAFPEFEGQTRAAGLEFMPLAEGHVNRGAKAAADRRTAARRGRRPALLALAKDARSVAGQRLADALAACEGADAIVTNELALLLGWQAAEHLGSKLVRVRLCPPPRMAHRPVARAVRQLAWLAMRRMLAAPRRESGLPELPAREPLGQLDAQRTLELYAFSPAVVPAPARSGPWTHVTGYWFLDGDVDPEPSQALLEFLADGPPPVCIGFGSMADADPTATIEMAVQALHGAGQRGVLIRGQLGVGAAKLPESVLAIDRIGHEWLFERCAAVVHHGGAGTAAAVLRAGLPSVVVPHMIDQKAWGRALHELGVAPAPIPRRKLSARRLQEAIVEAVTNPRMRERAASVGERIREEDGIANAVETFERHLGFVPERSTLEVTNG
jgi:sterol 3beta-glucosyltransferase